MRESRGSRGSTSFLRLVARGPSLSPLAVVFVRPRQQPPPRATVDGATSAESSHRIRPTRRLRQAARTSDSQEGVARRRYEHSVQDQQQCLPSVDSSTLVHILTSPHLNIKSRPRRDRRESFLLGPEIPLRRVRLTDLQRQSRMVEAAAHDRQGTRRRRGGCRRGRRRRRCTTRLTVPGAGRLGTDRSHRRSGMDAFGKVEAVVCESRDQGQLEV